MRTRVFLVASLAAGLALAGCGGAADPAEQAASSAAGPVGLRYADVAPQYAAATTAALERGRAVVDQLVAGDVAAVYEQSSPKAKAEASLEQVTQAFAELQAKAPIGRRLEERAMLLGRDRTGYVAEHAWGGDRVRFQIGFDPTGLMPDAGPVRPLPADPRADRPAQARVRLPFEGLWWAGNAPNTELGNHHPASPAQRHAFDFVVWRDGATYRGDGRANADYWAWKQPVVSPAAGTVVSTQDGVADNRPGVTTDPTAPAGNHLVIDLGNGEYAVLAHFLKGSLRVAKGDRVEAGQVLGLTGSSGNSSEPHLHFHVQDRPDVVPTATGIPVRFEQYVADGVRHDRGTPSAGQFVSTAGRPGEGG